MRFKAKKSLFFFSLQVFLVICPEIEGLDGEK